ncbi:hypothetical protein V1478_000399 [Vespula squamosa]|uniref:Uncharacterized protein n=1 Tax=Vespula squamosa TaxID=30214 RepID=A0ABD2C5E2_VESSQ
MYHASHIEEAKDEEEEEDEEDEEEEGDEEDEEEEGDEEDEEEEKSSKVGEDGGECSSSAEVETIAVSDSRCE